MTIDARLSSDAIQRLSKKDAIELCEKKYPKDYKQKKILALAIVITAVALLIIPAVVTGLTALSLCSGGVGFLITSPIVLLAVTALAWLVDKKTHYWSGNVAKILLKKKSEEEAKGIQ